MPPRYGKIGRAAATLAVTLAVCGAFAARPDDRTPLHKTLDSLFYAGRYDTLRVLVPALIHDAEARGDSAALGRFVFQRGRVEITLGHQAAADRDFDRAIRLTEAARDTVGLLPALNFKAFVLRDRGHVDEAMALFERELDLARRAHVTMGEANATTNLAYRDLRRGQLVRARDGYERALELYRRTGSSYSMAGIASSMGMLYRALGETDSCRHWYGECLRLAQTHGYPLHQVWALNNLGELEADEGNQESAVRYYEAALAIGRRIGFDRGQALPLQNLAISWSYLGERDRAQQALDECLEVCRRAGFKDLEDLNTVSLGVLNLAAGRNHRAAELFRRILDQDFVYVELRRREAAYGLALALAQMDSVTQALRVLEPFVLAREGAPDLMVQPHLDLAYAEILRRDGRFEEALARATPVRDAMDRAGRTNLGVSARLIESSCRRRLGDLSLAAQALGSALDSLEVARKDVGEAEWREAYGQHVMSDVIEGCRVMLEYPVEASYADRVHRFYDTLQRFKTRTLLERIHDPRGGDSTPDDGALVGTITMSRLQREVLRPGELLLDLFAGPQETYMFAVTPDSCRLVSLPGERSRLAGQVSLYADVLSASARTTRDAYPRERLVAMHRSLGTTVLGPVADLIANATQVTVAPDGFYAGIPFATLVPADDGTVLLEAVNMVEVPSASVLEWARTKNGVDGETTAVVAVAGGPGARLQGAMQEVSALEGRYENVERIIANAGVLTTLADRAETGGILHIAAHARVNDESPWQSGFLLDAESDASETASRMAPAHETFLRAWEIARVKLPYDMAVLAGCETAAGRATTGEGVLGLTSAFLSAGVPVVVSSRWPVDDRATAVLMSHFYDHLSRGETVASALRAAQLAVRGNRRTSHPFYWAGFAVVGDGSRVLSPLKSGWSGDWRAILAGGVVAVWVTVWAIRRRRGMPLPTS